MNDSEYVYDVITAFGAQDIQATTVRYETVRISYDRGNPPSGLEAYEMIADQLVKPIQDFLRVNDVVAFHVFKRPDPETLSIHLRNKSFSRAFLDSKVVPSKQDMLDTLNSWKMRASYELETRNSYFYRKHIWLAKKRSPLRVETINNPVVPYRIDINEPCNEAE